MLLLAAAAAVLLLIWTTDWRWGPTAMVIFVVGLVLLAAAGRQ